MENICPRSPMESVFETSRKKRPPLDGMFGFRVKKKVSLRGCFWGHIFLEKRRPFLDGVYGKREPNWGLKKTSLKIASPIWK